MERLNFIFKKSNKEAKIKILADVAQASPFQYKEFKEIILRQQEDNVTHDIITREEIKNIEEIYLT